MRSTIVRDKSLYTSILVTSPKKESRRMAVDYIGRCVIALIEVLAKIMDSLVILSIRILDYKTLRMLEADLARPKKGFAPDRTHNPNITRARRARR